MKTIFKENKELITTAITVIAMIMGLIGLYVSHYDVYDKYIIEPVKSFFTKEKINSEDKEVILNFVKETKAQEVASELYSFANTSAFDKIVEENQIGGECVDSTRAIIKDVPNPMSQDEIEETTITLLNVCNHFGRMPSKRELSKAIEGWTKYVIRTEDVKGINYFKERTEVPKVINKDKVFHQIDLLKENNIPPEGIINFLISMKGMSEEDAANTYNIYLNKDGDNTLRERPEGGITEAMDFCKNEDDVEFCMARMGYE